MRDFFTLFVKESFLCTNVLFLFLLTFGLQKFFSFSDSANYHDLQTKNDFFTCVYVTTTLFVIGNVELLLIYTPVYDVHVTSTPYFLRKLQNSGMTYLKVAKFWNDRAVYINKILSL